MQRWVLVFGLVGKVALCKSMLLMQVWQVQVLPVSLMLVSINANLRMLARSIR